MSPLTSRDVRIETVSILLGIHHLQDAAVLELCERLGGIGILSMREVHASVVSGTSSLVDGTVASYDSLRLFRMSLFLYRSHL